MGGLCCLSWTRNSIHVRTDHWTSFIRYKTVYPCKRPTPRSDYGSNISYPCIENAGHLYTCIHTEKCQSSESVNTVSCPWNGWQCCCSFFIQLSSHDGCSPHLSILLSWFPCLFVWSLISNRLLLFCWDKRFFLLMLHAQLYLLFSTCCFYRFVFFNLVHQIWLCQSKSYTCHGLLVSNWHAFHIISSSFFLKQMINSLAIKCICAPVVYASNFWHVSIKYVL